MILIFTIQDVAKAAGVSTATVSRYLNKTAKVNDETAKKIVCAIEKYGYEPNFFGKGLRAGKTNMILVIISTALNSFYGKALKAIEDEAEKYGYGVLIAANYDNAEKENTYLSLLKNRLVDGVIVMRPAVTLAELDALSLQFPVVQCAEYINGSAAPFVSIDNYKAAYEVMENLIKSGHRKIGLISVGDRLLSAVLRQKAYLDALKNHGIENTYIEFGDYAYKKSCTAARSLIESGVDAIFALSDKMAGAAISVARDMGISVPNELSVVGFDNVDIAKVVTPQLTTVSQNQTLLGEKAFKKLINIIDGKKENSEFVDYKIIYRNSTK